MEEKNQILTNMSFNFHENEFFIFTPISKKQISYSHFLFHHSKHVMNLNPFYRSLESWVIYNCCTT